MIKVGIVGGTGYTGVELLRILSQHSEVSIQAITSRKEMGMAVAELFPSLRGRIALKFCDPADAKLDKCDLVFFATPNGIAMQQTRVLLDAGVRVIDLAADFRLKDVSEWEQWYGIRKPAGSAISRSPRRWSIAAKCWYPPATISSASTRKRVAGGGVLPPATSSRAARQ